MKLEEVLIKRSDSKCELCNSANSTSVYEVPPQTHSYEENSLMVCANACSYIPLSV
jgi:protein PhnA